MNKSYRLLLEAKRKIYNRRPEQIRWSRENTNYYKQFWREQFGEAPRWTEWRTSNIPGDRRDPDIPKHKLQSYHINPSAFVLYAPYGFCLINWRHSKSYFSKWSNPSWLDSTCQADIREVWILSNTRPIVTGVTTLLLQTEKSPLGVILVRWTGLRCSCF